MIIDLSANDHSKQKIIDWIRQNKIKTLNVAGPRESQFPGIYELASKLLTDTLNLIETKKTVITAQIRKK